jgi:DNA-binding transcriptional regulator YdaS (Cro superfamily)
MGAWRQHVRRAVRAVGSQEELARAIGCSQAKVSWLLLSAAQIKAEDALAIERATDGRVRAAELRPDLWPVASGEERA